MSELPPTTCETCRHWHRGAPALARAERDPSMREGEGTCQLTLPFVVAVNGGISSVWPITRAERVCGEWEPRIPDGPDGGQVVPIRPRPAA